MLGRIKNSIAFRSGGMYEWFCTRLPNPDYKPGPDADFTFLSMTGRTHLEMLNQCLISLHNNWTKRPALILYSDGSLKPEDIQKKLSWWKGSMQVKSHEDILTWTKKSGSVGLNDFAHKEAVGRKLGCILKEAEKTTILWCDTDILWYKDLPYEPSNLPLIFKTSEDYQSAYDGYLSKESEALIAKPYINTGMVLLNNSLLDKAELSVYWEKIGNHPNHFTEQTFLALASKLLGGEVWSMTEVACFQSDRFDLKPSFQKQPWVARHYVGPVRHLFWKDAFFNRTKLL